jgi:hypothetical protein
MRLLQTPGNRIIQCYECHTEFRLGPEQDSSGSGYQFHSTAEAVMALTTQPHPKTDVKERVELYVDHPSESA